MNMKSGTVPELLDETIGAREIARALRLRRGRPLFDLGIGRPLLEPGTADLRDAAAVAHAERLHRQPLLPRQLPDVRRRLIRDPAAGDERAVLRVAERPRALRELGRVRRRRPGLSVLRDFTAAIEVVEQHELLGERVLVRRHVASEERQAGIAVALLQITEHLIVGPVLFHDEEHVRDRRRLSDRGGNNGVAGGA
jgi:hypothetical protein